MKNSSWLACSAVVFFAMGSMLATPNDAAACRLGIGDFVWQDNNGNGIQDGGEPGINGVRVTISPGYYSNPLDPNSFVTSVVTANGPGDANGYYLFSGVDCQVNYTIAIDFSTVPAGLQATAIGVGAANSDSNNPQGTVVNLPLTGFNYVDDTIDFGFIAPVVCAASVGNFVFNDANNNGIQDGGEAGIAGAVVTLSGGATASGTTGAGGGYSFGNLCAGTYTVCVGTPMGFQASPANEGTDDALDSDGLANGSNSCAAVTLAAGETNTSIDFGFWQVPTTGPGTGTPGFWKTHPEAWPVETIVIGGVVYTRTQAISWMDAPDGDKSVTMFRALVAAKLNVLVGNVSSCIDSTIAAADSWMATNGPVGSGVKARSAAWKAGEPLAWELDAYNNGDRCAPHRQ